MGARKTLSCALYNGALADRMLTYAMKPTLKATDQRGARCALCRRGETRADSRRGEWPSRRRIRKHTTRCPRRPVSLASSEVPRRRARFLRGGAGPCSPAASQRTILKALELDRYGFLVGGGVDQSGFGFEADLAQLVPILPAGELRIVAGQPVVAFAARLVQLGHRLRVAILPRVDAGQVGVSDAAGAGLVVAAGELEALLQGLARQWKLVGAQVQIAEAERGQRAFGRGVQRLIEQRLRAGIAPGVDVA